jgi:NitT/TauT family transport system substrate-binding protein
MTIRIFTPSRRAMLKTGLAGLSVIAAPAIISTRAAAMTPLKMQLDWKFNVQFAGLFMAQEAGLYAKEKLEVSIAEWTDTVDPVMAAAGSDDTISCAEQNIVVRGQAEGKPIKAIATMFQASPYGLMALPDAPLDNLDALKGKTIGVHDDGVKIMALVMGVSNYKPDDIKVVNVPYDKKFDRVISGECVAVQCYVVDEPLGFEAAYKIKPKIMRMSDHGFRSAAQTIMASEAMFASKPDAVRGFLKATFDGWRLALADIPGTAKIVAEKYAVKGSKYADVAYQTASLALIKDYVEMGVTTQTLGMINPENWKGATELMAKYGIIDKVPDMSKSMTMEFMSVA